MHGNASLNQGKFFVKKKRSHQYLENNSNVLLRENFSNGTLREGFQEGNANDVYGNEEKKNIDNWYIFPEQMIDFGGATPQQSTDPNTKLIQNWRNPNDSEWNETLDDAIEAVAKKLKEASSYDDNIYAFIINNSTGNIIYYKKDATGSIPLQPVPKLKSGAFTTYLKIDNGMAEAQQRTIITDDPINRSVKDEREEYNKLQQAYDKAINQYKGDIIKYYDAKEKAQEARVTKPHRNSLIKYDSGGGTISYGFVNTMGGLRKINVHDEHLPTIGDQKAVNSVEAIEHTPFRSKIGCPTPKKDAGGAYTVMSNTEWLEAAYESTDGTVGLKDSYGSCLNPGLYQSDGTDAATKIFVDEKGDISLLNNTLSNGCKRHLNNVTTLDENLWEGITKSNRYTTATAKTADFECNFGLDKDDDDMKAINSRVDAANKDMMLISDCDTTDGTPNQCDLKAYDELGESLYKGIFKDNGITIHKGMRQVIEDVQGKVGGSGAGFRKLHHSIMNDDIVHLPFEGKKGEVVAHWENGVKQDNVHKDISGNVPLQRALNKKLRLADDLGSSIDSLEASLELKNRQIKASSLQFLAWGLAGITIAAITVREFAKK
jgi:hypothetical protein